MKCNVGGIDRVIRAIVGLVAIGLIFLVSSTVFKIILGIVGVVMLATATFGFCLLYIPLGISTCKAEKQ